MQRLTVASVKTEGRDSMSTVEGGRLIGTPFDASRSRVSLTCMQERGGKGNGMVER